VRFSAREEVQPILQDVNDKIIRNVSAGYATYRVEMIPPQNLDDLWVYRAIDWEPIELSLVPIGADAGAETREHAMRAGERSFPCEFITPAGAAADSQPQERTMKKPGQGGEPAAEENAGTTTEQQEEQQRAAGTAAAATAACGCNGGRRAGRWPGDRQPLPRRGKGQRAGGVRVLASREKSPVDQLRAQMIDEIAVRAESQPQTRRADVEITGTR
jgi:hypothetical protein